MILQRVALTNVRSYEFAQLSLSEGITALWGDIGSGKSSLLYAVEVALFGFADIEWNHLLRQGKDTARVEVTLGGTGPSLTVQRDFTRSRTDAAPNQKCALVIEGSRTSYGVTEMKGRVTEMLGFPESPNPRRSSEVWRWAVYIRQESMREILSEEGDRLEVIRKAHGLEEYRVARENVPMVQTDLRDRVRRHREEAKRLRDEAAGLEDDSHQIAAARERLPVLEKALQDLEAQVQQASDRVAKGATLREAIRLAQQNLDHLTERENALLSKRQQLEQQARKLTNELGVTETERTSFLTAVQTTDPIVESSRELEARLAEERLERESLEGRKTELSEAWVHIEEALRRKGEAQKRLDTLTGTRSQLERELSALEGQWAPSLPSPPTEDTRFQIEEGLAKVQARLQELAKERGISENREEELAELLKSGTCPRCGQPVDVASFQHHLDEASAHRGQLEVQHQTLTQEEKRLRQLLNALSKYESMRSEWRILGERIQERRSRLAALDAEIGEVRQRLSEERASPEAASKLRVEWDELNQTVQDARKREEVLFVKVQSVRKHEEKRQKSEHQIEVLSERIQNLQKNLEQLTTEARSVSEEISKIASVREEVMAEISKRSEEAQAFSGADAELERHRKEQTKVREDRVRLEKELEALERQRQRKEDAASRSLREESEARVRLEQVEWLRGFVRACEEIERVRLERIRADFLSEFSRCFSRLVDDDLMGATVDAGFRPLVSMNGEMLPAAALSGGERTALALAYRLALRQSVLSAQRIQLETLVLDEPTDGFSAEQVAKLSELLRELPTRQVILVSHEQNLAGIAHHMVHIVKREGHSEIEGSPQDPAPSSELVPPGVTDAGPGTQLHLV